MTELQQILGDAALQDDLLPPPLAAEEEGRAPDGTFLIYGRDEAVVWWTRQQLGRPELDPFGPACAIGVAGWGDLIAGIVFHNYRMPSIDVTFAASTPRWCSRRNLRAIFAYPFSQLGLARVGATAPVEDRRVRRFLVGVGFQIEGLARAALTPSLDAPLGDRLDFGMTASACPWTVDGAERRDRLLAARRRPS